MAAESAGKLFGLVVAAKECVRSPGGDRHYGEVARKIAHGFGEGVPYLAEDACQGRGEVVGLFVFEAMEEGEGGTGARKGGAREVECARAGVALAAVVGGLPGPAAWGAAVETDGSLDTREGGNAVGTEVLRAGVAAKFAHARVDPVEH